LLLPTDGHLFAAPQLGRTAVPQLDNRISPPPHFTFIGESLITVDSSVTRPAAPHQPRTTRSGRLSAGGSGEASEPRGRRRREAGDQPECGSEARQERRTVAYFKISRSDPRKTIRTSPRVSRTQLIVFVLAASLCSAPRVRGTYRESHVGLPSPDMGFRVGLGSTAPWLDGPGTNGEARQGRKNHRVLQHPVKASCR